MLICNSIEIPLLGRGPAYEAVYATTVGYEIDLDSGLASNRR